MAEMVKFTCPRCGSKDFLRKYTRANGLEDSEDVLGVVSEDPPLYSSHDGPPFLCFASSGMAALETDNEDGIIYACHECDWMMEDDQGKDIENDQDMAKWIVEHQ